MADTEERPEPDATAKADALAQAEQAEAEAAEAEALAAAARARARAIRLRREAETQAAEDEATTEAAEDAETVEEPAAKSTEASTKPAEASTEPARRRSWVPKVAVALMVVAILGICALSGLSGYLIWHHHQADKQRQQAAEFIAAAKQGVTNLLSMDFNNAKRDVQRVLDNSTGQFKDDFQQRAGDFTTVVEQSKVVTEGSAKATALDSMTKDSAVVLILANERVTNSAGAKEEPRAFRLRVSVTREGDQIKMSKVEFVL